MISKFNNLTRQDLKPEQILEKFFGYNSFRPGQEEIIQSIISGNDVLAVLPTGAGKSICYQVPALISESFSVVISPLISLMKDQVDSLNSKEQISAFINSTLDRFESEKVLNEIAAGKIKLLYVAPEKLLSLEFIQRIKNLVPQFLFVDEAHCISEWGHNFRPSYRKILDFAQEIGIKNISAFTATATPEVRDDIIKQLKLKEPDVFVKGFERENIFIEVFETPHKKEKSLELIQKYGGPAIVYCSTRKSAEEAAEFLRLHKIEAHYYHAGLNSQMRKVIQDDFLTGKVETITATNAFGMGIDKGNIRLIIHYNMPGSIENYYQEIGRAGRDGNRSHAAMLFESRDTDIHEYLIKNSFPTRDMILNSYNSVCDYAGIAVGDKFDNDIVLDEKIKMYLSSNQIPEPMFISSLEILQKSNYLKLLPPSFSRIKFNFSIDDVKKYIKSLAGYDLRDTLVVLLKKYGKNVFEKFVSINLEEFAFSLETDFESISKRLHKLNEIGILSFEAHRSLAVVKMLTERQRTSSLIFDFADLLKRQNVSLEKLNSIQDLVFTKQCRFNQILNYFGEDNENYKCGHCDNCRSPEEKAENSSSYIEEKIIQTLQIANGNIEQKYLLRILTGTSNHQSLKAYDSFGSCRMYKRNEIENVVNLMTKKKLLSNFNSVLSFSEKALEQFSEQIKEHQPKIVSNYESTLALFNKLRELRKEIASRFNQSQNLICDDKTLRLVAEEAPKTAAELMSVQGFTRRMFNKFGLELIEVVNEFKKETGRKQNTNIPEHLLNTISLIEKGYSLFEISNIKKLPEAVISFEIESIIEFNPSIDISKILDKKDYKMIKDSIDDYDVNLKIIKEKLPNKISYAQIRIVMAKLKAIQSAR